jgi:uncharacterized protein YebE (UPF0316 family)
MIVRFRVRDRGYYDVMKKNVLFLVSDLPDELRAHGLVVGNSLTWYALSRQANRLFFKVVATGREGTVMTVDLLTNRFDW